MVLFSIDMHTRFISRAKTRLRFSADGKGISEKILPQFILVHHVIRSNRRRHYRPQGQGFLQGSFPNRHQGTPCPPLSSPPTTAAQLNVFLLSIVFRIILFHVAICERVELREPGARLSLKLFLLGVSVPSSHLSVPSSHPPTPPQFTLPSVAGSVIAYINIRLLTKSSFLPSLSYFSFCCFVFCRTLLVM